MDYLVRPELPIIIGEQTYTLSPSLNCLKNLQHHFQSDILKITDKVSEMKIEEHAKIIEIAIKANGEIPPETKVIEQFVVDNGIIATGYLLWVWLLLITRPKSEQEEASEKMGKLLENLTMGRKEIIERLAN